MWFVYIVRCVDGTLYTGMTSDLKRRLHEHNHDDRKGAKYTSLRRPVKLVYQEPSLTRSSAMVREHAIKKLTHAKKIQLIMDQK